MVRGESQPLEQLLLQQGYSQLQPFFGEMGNHIPGMAEILPKPWEGGNGYPSYGSNPLQLSGDSPGSAWEGIFLLLISSLSDATPAEGSPAVFILLKHIPAMDGEEEPWGTPKWPPQPLCPSFQQQNSCP